MESQTTSDIIVLIPIKDYSNTKTRIKDGLPSKKKLVVEQLVEATFIQTLHLLNEVGLSFVVVSPSKRILKESQKKGAKFTYLDNGTDLNGALSQAIKELKIRKQILILMPDLPFLTLEFLTLIIKKVENSDISIIPSISRELGNIGTALLYMSKPNLIECRFGKNSSQLHQKEAQELNLTYQILEFDPYARDLDTLLDLQYLHEHIEMVKEPNRFEHLLENLF